MKLYRVKYEGYLKRELLNIDKFYKQDGITIPSGFSYEGILVYEMNLSKS